MKLFNKKTFSALGLILITSLFCNISLASLDDVKDKAIDDISKKHGYGLGYGVINYTPNIIVASSTIIPTVSSKDLQSAYPAKVKGYSIMSGDTSQPHDSSMIIRDQATDTQICTVNVHLKGSLGLFDDRPDISNLKASIDAVPNSPYTCSIQDKDTFTKKGKKGAYVLVLVTMKPTRPMEASPK